MHTFQVFLALLSPTLLLFLSDFRLANGAKHTGFTIEMIHRDSPESPYYPGNFSFQELLLRHVSRAAHLESNKSYTKNSISSKLVEPYIYNTQFLYLIQLRIGDPGQHFYLIMDTGGILSWVKCKPVKNSFNRNSDYFNPLQSRSYKSVACNSPLCTRLQSCRDGLCIHKSRYFDGTEADTVLARELFAFHSPHEDDASFTNILFGCADPEKTTHQRTGIVGMRNDPRSFTSQISWYTDYRFSYCLVAPTGKSLAPSSFLKFGPGALLKGRDVQTTPFVKHPLGWTSYFLNLLDISISGRRLRYPPESFQINARTGEGGFVIDSGSAISWLRGHAYWRLHNYLVDYFDTFHLQRLDSCLGGVYGKKGIQLCYNVPDYFTQFPSMTLHFENADYELAPEQLFVIDRRKEQFWMAIALNNEENLLGAWQQHNKRILYDNAEKSLSFVTENC